MKKPVWTDIDGTKLFRDRHGFLVNADGTKPSLSEECTVEAWLRADAQQQADRAKADLFDDRQSGCANLWGRNPEEAMERWFDEHDVERAAQDAEQAALNARGPLPPITAADWRNFEWKAAS